MLNPALLATVVAVSAETFQEASGRPLPFAYPYLVAPLVLHKETREALPRRTNSHWATWLLRHPVLASGFPERARSLVPSVSEGVRFGLAHGALAVTVDGHLEGALAPQSPARVGDIADIVRAAGFVGKWLTKLEHPATAFALLGVRP